MHSYTSCWIWGSWSTDFTVVRFRRDDGGFANSFLLLCLASCTPLLHVAALSAMLTRWAEALLCLDMVVNNALCVSESFLFLVP